MDNKLKIAISILIFFGVCLILIWQSTHITAANADLVWYSVIPPLLAITLAVATSRLFLSLGVAVGAGFLIAWGWQNWTFEAFTSEFVWFVREVSVGNDGIDLFNVWVILFVLFMMSTISVVVASGGIASAVSLLSHLARGPRSSQFVTALMGTLIFVGDYSNAMLVGPTMRPITDQNNVSREKLAYIVDSTSAPIAGLAFVSTWIGYEVGLFDGISKTLGLGTDGYEMFFDALAFRFYCILTIIFVIINAISGRDYGAMRTAQKRARETGQVAAPDAKVMENITADNDTEKTKGQIFSALIPLALLFGLILGGLWVDGNRAGGSIFALSTWQVVFSKPIFSLNAWRDALSNANNVMVLAAASTTAFIAAIICGKLFSKMPFSDIGKAVWKGLSGTLMPIGIILCAWGLKASCDKLMTGQFIAAMLSDVVSPLWFPALVFFIASLISFSTGTSWGTMGILIPTAIPVAFALDNGSYGITTIICLGAVLDGAIFGDHCSPISDTTILSAIVSSCDPMHHVRTQLPYALTVACIALMCGYLPAALGLPSWIGITIGVGIIGLLFYVLYRLRPD